MEVFALIALLAFIIACVISFLKKEYGLAFVAAGLAFWVLTVAFPKLT